MVGLTLLGLLARMIGHGDESRVGWSALILLVLFAPMRGGAFLLVLALGLAFVLASSKDYSNRLLIRGMVRGDVEQVMGGMGL